MRSVARVLLSLVPLDLLQAMFQRRHQRLHALGNSVWVPGHVDDLKMPTESHQYKSNQKIGFCLLTHGEHVKGNLETMVPKYINYY